MNKEIEQFRTAVSLDALERAKATYDRMPPALQKQALRSIPVAQCIIFCDRFKLPR